MRKRLLRPFAALLATVLLGSCVRWATAQEIVIPPRPIDRKFPTEFCPIPIVFTFLSVGNSVTLRFAANTRTATGQTIVQGIDNISVAPIGVYDANHGSCQTCPSYFGDGGGPVSSFYFNRPGLTIPFLDTFTTNPVARGWDMSQGAVWDVTKSAPTDPEANTTSNPGFLRLSGSGTGCAGDTARTSVVVNNLVYSYPHGNVTYAVTGWWYVGAMVEGQTTLVVSVDTYPPGNAAPTPQWSTDPNVNQPIAVGNDEDKSISASVSDGAGGMILFWADAQADDAFSGSHGYAQRIDAFGRKRWLVTDVPFSTSNTAASFLSAATSDGFGGAIAVFLDSGILRAQRLSSNGQRLWDSTGVSLCPLPQNGGISATSDGAGGAFIVWSDPRDIAVFGTELYGQHVNAAGTPLWGSSGISLVNAAAAQSNPRLVSDGAGGCIAVWDDLRNNATTGTDLYAQRWNTAGSAQWGGQGVPVCVATGLQSQATIVSDGAQGAVVGWVDSRNPPTSTDLYAQSLGATGLPRWAANGVAVCNETAGLGEIRCVSDRKGGAIWAWIDQRTSDPSVCSQRMTAAGARRWTAAGIPLCTAVGGRFGLNATDDGASGLIATWNDFRLQLPQGGDDPNQFAQRIDSAGVVKWAANGASISTAFDNQIGNTIVPDPNGGAILAWNDSRNRINGSGDYFNNIFGQRIDRAGRLGTPEPLPTGIGDVPTDGGGVLQVSWKASTLDRASAPNINQYRLWRRDPGGAMQMVKTISATRACSYVTTVPTGFDAVEGVPSPRTWVWVEAFQTSNSESWFAPPDSASSFDNPPPPVTSCVSYAGSGVTGLRWKRAAAPDIVNYRIYRAQDYAAPLDSMVVWFASTADTEYVDSTPDPLRPRYFVAARDEGALVGPPVLATPGSTVDVGPGRVFVFSLDVPAPNPSRDETSVAFSLPAAGPARIGIYGVSGRRVREERWPALEPGSHRWAWDGRDAAGRTVAPGLYLLRLETDAGMATRRILRLRP
jgi:hypothetical protein